MIKVQTLGMDAGTRILLLPGSLTRQSQGGVGKGCVCTHIYTHTNMYNTYLYLYLFLFLTIYTESYEFQHHRIHSSFPSCVFIFSFSKERHEPLIHYIFYLFDQFPCIQTISGCAVHSTLLCPVFTVTKLPKKGVQNQGGLQLYPFSFTLFSTQTIPLVCASSLYDFSSLKQSSTKLLNLCLTFLYLLNLTIPTYPLHTPENYGRREQVDWFLTQTQNCKVHII